MKINMSVECTPQELRDFLGWPDVGPVQQEMLARVSELMGEGSSAIDPASLMRPFLAPNTQAMEAMQNAFLQAMQSGMSATAKTAGKKNSKS